MALDSVELVSIIVLGLLGLFGGIPQLLRLIKPKPHIEIISASIVRLPNENYKFQFRLQVENKKIAWKRNSDASNITFDFYVMDKDSVQRGGSFDQMVTQYLLAGFKVVKETEVYLSLPPDGNPYTVVFRVVCKEGQDAVKKIALEAQPIAYS